MPEKKLGWREKFGKVKDIFDKVWKPKFLRPSKDENVMMQCVKGVGLGVWQVAVFVGGIAAVGTVAPKVAGGLFLAGVVSLATRDETRMPRLSEINKNSVLNHTDKGRGKASVNTRSLGRDNKQSMLTRIQTSKNNSQQQDVEGLKTHKDKKIPHPYQLSDKELSKFICNNKAFRR